MPLRSAASFYGAQQRRQTATLAAVRAEWSRLPSPSAWTASTLNRITALLTAAQLGAARDATTYVAAALAEQGTPIEPVAQISPAGAAGIAYGLSPDDAFDGYPLSMLVNIAPGIADGRGASVAEKMAAGQAFLGMLTQFQIAEAGSAASASGISARPRMGWVRCVNPPCCKDCAVQAGKWFAHNRGFQRHPHCDCYHVPAPRNADISSLAPSPSLDQVTGLTVAERQAIEDGADFNQVVNSARGRVSKWQTLEGTTRRGWASYVRRSIDAERGTATATTVERANGGRRNVTRTRRRLTPRAIYQLASSREEAVRMLIENGYLVGDLKMLARLVA